MKRGLITWDKTELPPEAFDARLAELRKEMAARDLPAMLIYSDVWQSNFGRYFTNFMPYWNRALIVVPAAEKPVLLCSLSPRVYPWIKSVTIFEEIKPSPNLPQRVFEMCSEKAWTKIGTLGALPYDLAAALPTGVATEELDWRPAPDSWAVEMYRSAAFVARYGLEREIRMAPGLIDYEFVSRLERLFRRSGAEDLIVLLTNGERPPAPARGAMLQKTVSVVVALEYRGHWVKVARNALGIERAQKLIVEDLSGPYPYQFGQGTISATLTEVRHEGSRLFYGDSFIEAERL